VEETTKTNTLAIVSLLLSLVALPGLVCYGCGAIAFGIAAVVVGVVARRAIAASGGAETGQGLALAGVIIGAIAAGLGLLFGIAMLAIGSLSVLGPEVEELFRQIAGSLSP
jgi:hypothetical protein